MATNLRTAAMRARLQRISKQSPDEFARAGGIEVQAEAREVARRTPYRFGNLRSSVRWRGPYRDGRRITFLIIAGGPTAPYARIVDRRPAQHEQGQAFYMESVLDESRRYLIGRIGKRIDVTKL